MFYLYNNNLHYLQEEEGADREALKDILRLPDNLLHTDLVNTIMNERDGEIKSETLITGIIIFNSLLTEAIHQCG